MMQKSRKMTAVDFLDEIHAKVIEKITAENILFQQANVTQLWVLSLTT